MEGIQNHWFVYSQSILAHFRSTSGPLPAHFRSNSGPLPAHFQPTSCPFRPIARLQSTLHNDNIYEFKVPPNEKGCGKSPDSTIILIKIKYIGLSGL